MTLRSNRPVIADGSAPEIGVFKYDRMCVHDIDDDLEVLAMLLEAVNIHSFNNRKRDDFNFHPDNPYPKKAPFELKLPPGIDPRGPVLQLARAGIDGCGFSSVLAIDSTKSLVSNPATGRVVQYIDGLSTKPQNSHGLVIMVERSEDAGNERLQRLRQSMAKLTVPSMYVITMATPEVTSYEPINLSAEVIADS